MKLKKFVKHINEYTRVEIYDDVCDERLYAGNVFDIPKKILNYEMDNRADVTVEIKYGDNLSQYLVIAIPVLTNCW